MKLLVDIPDAMKKVIDEGKGEELGLPRWLAYSIYLGKPLATVLDEIRAEMPKLACCENEYRQALVKVADVIKCIDKHRKGESE